jgi:hypothetical protein
LFFFPCVGRHVLLYFSLETDDVIRSRQFFGLQDVRWAT